MEGGQEAGRPQWSAEDVAVAKQVLDESGVLDKIADRAAAAAEKVTRDGISRVTEMAENMLRIVERMEAREAGAFTARSTQAVEQPTPPATIIGDIDEPVRMMPSSTAVIVKGLIPYRRKRVKSSEEIRAFIINAMNSYGKTPPALLNVLSGFVNKLQDDMKLDHEDGMAARACEGGHPGRPAEGVYCKLCHDSQMAGRFGSIQGQPPRDGADSLFSLEGTDVPPIDRMGE